MHENSLDDQTANIRQPMRLTPHEIGGRAKKDVSLSHIFGLNGFYDHYKQVPKRSLSEEEMSDLQEIDSPFLVDEVRDEINDRLESFKGLKRDSEFTKSIMCAATLKGSRYFSYFF